MKIHRLFLFFFLPCAVALAPTPHARATGTTSPAVPPSAEKSIPYESPIAGPNDGYVEPTYQNLSKMYWAVGKFNREDDEAVDNYLKINECDLYTQYYGNDFDWIKIREATRAHIQEKLSGMSNKFELLTPIELGRYDIEKEEFDVAEESKIRGIKNIDFNMNEHNRDISCGDKVSETKDYPRNMIVLLNRPIVLEKIPVEKDVAELFLKEKEKENAERGRNVHKLRRGAFLRLKVDVIQYKETVRVGNGSLRAVVYGRLEGYEIYADSAKTKPLYFYNVNDREAKRRLRRKKGTSEEPGTDAAEMKTFEDMQENPAEEQLTPQQIKRQKPIFRAPE